MRQSTLEDYTSSGVECPTCGRTDFKSEQGMKWHHAQVHGESLTFEERECVICGDTFKAHKDREDRKCCSLECMGEWQSQHRVGENHPNYRESVTVTCEYCGESEQVKPARAKNYVYCSMDCMSADFADGDYEGKTTVKCDYCGDTFQEFPNRIERNEHHFCSKECFGDSRSENYRGEDHWLWKGGYEPYYGDDWDEKRLEAIERDNAECWACGLSRDAHTVVYKKDISVHHVKRNTEGGSNELHNTITVCASCHKGFEPPR